MNPIDIPKRARNKINELFEKNYGGKTIKQSTKDGEQITPYELLIFSMQIYMEGYLNGYEQNKKTS